LLVLSHLPSSIVEVNNQCASIEAWAGRCDSVPQLLEAASRLAAIDDHLARTPVDGRARVSAAILRLEMRIGRLSTSDGVDRRA
jgi:hypothetical protein